jgi:ERCC4-type nuclease
VIEGILDRLDGRLTESALLKHITRMQFHHRLPVIQTASPQETLRIAQLIEEQWVKDKGQFSWQNAVTPVAASYVKSVCRDSPDTFLIGTLTQCRGVSEALARLIQAKYQSLEALLAATATDLATVGDPANPKRKVGKAVAERLYGLLHPPASN